jgi:glycosyltransferase involved in cell wall biosynthesis
MCRVTKNLPSSQDPGAGFHAYLLTKEIPAPTLIIIKRASKNRYPLPAHAVIREISYSDVPFTPVLGNGILQNGGVGFKKKIQIFLRLILKSKEILFFFKSVPHIVRFKPTIVHVDGLLCLLSGIFAKSVLRSRFVITLHNVTEAALVRKLRFLRYLLKYPDKIVCVSNAVKNILSNVIGPEKLEVIPCGVDLQIFKNQNLCRKNQLVAIGIFKWQKGYPYLIEAMDALSKSHQHQLLIIGDGPERPQIERQIEKLRLTDRVRLLGILPQEQIVKHLNESKLFIMSSLTEGLPRVLLEAIACGTPSVVTTACNAEGIIEKVGIAVEPANSRALAKAVETLLSDEERWNRLSKRCLQVAQEYGWNIIASRTLDLYKRL